MALSDIAARNAKPGKKMYKLTDEYGLYLQVNPAGTKRWYFNFVFDGKQSRIAFGGYPLVSLSRAREKRDEARLMILDGVHPKQKRIAEKEAEEDALNTFEKMAREWSQ